MDKVNFALIGCGRISDRHFEAIANIPEAEIIACCDIIESRAIEASKKYKVSKYYTDYKEMLDKEEVHAVLICGPSGLHSEMGIEAAKNQSFTSR